MNRLSRRAFFGVSVGGMAALHSEGPALAALQSADALGLPPRMNVEYASALNLRLFLQNKDKFSLTGVVSVRPVTGELGSYRSGSLFLYPFKRSVSVPDMRAFLPGRSAADPLVATVPTTSLGLSPDEYFCNYVLKAPRQSFISFSVDTPSHHGGQKRPWQSNVDNIGNGSVGIGWTSSNLNHPWFGGSRWIPDDENGQFWRARIIEGLRQASALASTLV
jgi:hypothetical protein